jgi:uncharacterized membrane protein YcaP (DUF421 family)
VVVKKEDIHLSDLKRILLGQAPLEFMLEAFLRTLFIFVLLLIALRLSGKRMNRQLTIVEMAVMIMLGAIVSVPMQIPNRGLLPGVLILSCIVVFHRGINWLSYKEEKIERLTQGAMCTLVKDGCLNLEEMASARVSQQQLFAALRQKGIRHLGEVKRVYLEACGLFSIYKSADPKPGLTVLPPEDPHLVKAQPRADGEQACLICGYVAKRASECFACPCCGNHESMPALI